MEIIAVGGAKSARRSILFSLSALSILVFACAERRELNSSPTMMTRPRTSFVVEYHGSLTIARQSDDSRPVNPVIVELSEDGTLQWIQKPGSRNLMIRKLSPTERELLEERVGWTIDSLKKFRTKAIPDIGYFHIRLSHGESTAIAEFNGTLDAFFSKTSLVECLDDQQRTMLEPFIRDLMRTIKDARNVNPKKGTGCPGPNDSGDTNR